MKILCRTSFIDRQLKQKKNKTKRKICSVVYSIDEFIFHVVHLYICAAIKCVYNVCAMSACMYSLHVQAYWRIMVKIKEKTLKLSCDIVEVGFLLSSCLSKLYCYHFSILLTEPHSYFFLIIFIFLCFDHWKIKSWKSFYYYDCFQPFNSPS